MSGRRSTRIAAKPPPALKEEDEEDPEESEEDIQPAAKKRKTATKKRAKKDSDADSDSDSGPDSDSDTDTKKPKKGSKKKAAPKKKQKKESEQDDNEDDPDEEEDPFKAGPNGIPSREQMKAIKSASAKTLKEALARNYQIQSGSKEELQDRITTCIQNGCYPKCPLCRLRPSKFKTRDGNLECPGYVDDEGKFTRCSYWHGKDEYADLVLVRPEWVKGDGQEI
ncbi:UNVERIFIED_CONTAM: hypothetical protein HDU68_000601 [Siphonaria sp. JEL0065]|nr:hypothetical protein HDU68_000601 [Siphonaria sp. JEL0065]